MSQILVTGAAGFIGAAIAKKMLALGHEVVTVDNLSTGYIDNIPANVKFYQGDLQDATLIAKLEKYKFEAIFHIAGQSSGEISFDNPVYDLQTNAQSTLLLLKLAIAIGCKKFFYASTMSVYGDQPDEPIDENRTTFPKSFYGVGKLASERYLDIYQKFGIDCVALRLFNVYGPGQNMSNLRQGMVSIFLKQALDGKSIVVKGSKDRYRDFVYIDDVVNAFLLAYTSGLKGYNVYNVGTGIRTTIESAINLIKQTLPFQVDVEYKGSTPGDQFGIYADVKKIKTDLNWQPEIEMEQGLRLMYNWTQSLS